MRERPLLAFDTETTGLYPFHGAEMFSYSTCTEDGTTDVRRLDTGNKRELSRAIKHLKSIWKKYNVIMHNAKFDLHFTEKLLGENLEDIKFECTHKLSHIVRNDYSGHGLKTLSWDLCAYPKDDYEEIQALRKAGGSFQDIPEPIMDRYQRSDTERTMLLYLVLMRELNKHPEWRDPYQVEKEIIITTMRMEQRGMKISPGRCNRLQRDLEREAEKAKELIWKAAGDRINPLSGPAIQKLLYQTMGLPRLGATKKTGVAKTSKDVIIELRERHPECKLALDAILKYRAYRKGAKFLEDYQELADPDTELLHADINTCAAITSRQSCKHPNLHNVSKTNVLLNPFPVPLRKVFVPKPGNVNIHIDYSGIEMRLAVHYSRDPEMLKLFKAGLDPQMEAAKILYGREKMASVDKLTRKSMRDAAKNTNYAIIYGAGMNQIRRTLGVRHGEINISAYKTRFGALCALNRDKANEVRSQGYVTTVFGRRLYVPTSKPYVGVNFLIQCTAAEIMKRAQNRVHEYLQNRTKGKVGLIMSIHDEIILELPREKLDFFRKPVLKHVTEIMTDFPEFLVPLEVDMAITRTTWENKKAFKL